MDEAPGVNLQRFSPMGAMTAGVALAGGPALLAEPVTVPPQASILVVLSKRSVLFNRADEPGNTQIPSVLADTMVRSTLIVALVSASSPMPLCVMTESLISSTPLRVKTAAVSVPPTP